MSTSESKSKGKAGRRPKITPEIEKKIVEALRAGNYVQVACDYAGIAYSTFYDWLKRGESGQPQFVGFSNAVREALARGEMKLVFSVDKYATGRPAQFDEQGRLIQDSIPPDWRAAAWMLERKFPDRWAKREQLDLGKAKGDRADGSYEKLLEIIDRVEKKADESSE